MNRRLLCQQQAIEDGFERLVRESPRPLLINSDHSLFEEQQQQQIIRPVPSAVFRNRAPTFVSPLAKTLVSPHPQYNSNQDVSIGNESIEELFDYLKQKSSDLSEKNRNISENFETDQSKSFYLSKEQSVSNIFEACDDEIETLETSFSPHVNSHQQNANVQGNVHGNAQVKDVSSTVYNSIDEVDAYDTGYSTSNFRDFSLSGDELIHNDNVTSHDQVDKQSCHLEPSYQKDHSDEDFNNEIRPSSEQQNDAASNVETDDGSFEIECREIGEDGTWIQQTSVEKPNMGENREPCTLYMWIIKPIPGTQFICVEGKKHPDEDEFWKSGVITERLNETTVLTQSGSIYRLQGNIETADAVYAGFSRETVAAFKTGFPEDWKELIHDHFNNSSLLDGQNISETELLTSTVNEPVVTEAKNSNQDKQKEYVLTKWLVKPLGKGVCVVGLDRDNLLWHSSAIEKRLDSKRLMTSSGSLCRLKGHMDKLQAKEDNIPEVIIAKFHSGFPKEWQELTLEHFGGNRQTINDKETSTVSTVDKPVVTVDKTSHQGKETEYVLSKWLVKPLAKGICVVGLNRDGILWHSSAIEKRLDSRRLMTSSGSLCRLKGHMDKLQAKEDNIPDVIISKFHSGFPKEWQELTQEHFGAKRSAVKADRRQKIGKEKEDKNRKTGTYCKTRVNKSRQVQSNRKKNSSVTDRKSSDKKAEPDEKSFSDTLCTPDNKALPADTSVLSEDTLEKTILTPAGQLVNLENLKRSRTGRIIKPCVHWWAGQKVQVTEEGLVLKATTEYASRYLKSVEEEYENTSKVYGRYIYSKSNDTTISSISSLSSISSESSNKSLAASSITTQKEIDKKQNKSVLKRSSRKSCDTKSGLSETLPNSSNTKNSKKLNERDKKQHRSVLNRSSKKIVVTKSDLSETRHDSSYSKTNKKLTESDKEQNRSVLNRSSKKSVVTKTDFSETVHDSSCSETNKKLTESSDKEQNRSGLNRPSKKMVVSKSETFPDSNQSKINKKWKIKQTTTKDSDPRLDQEIFVLLNEVKKDLLRNKEPSRSTCYSTSEKTPKTNTNKNSSDDPYLLNESNESGNENKDVMSESNLVSSGKDATVKQSGKNKKIQVKSDCPENERSNKVQKKDHGLRELVNLQCDVIRNENMQISNRVTRSKSSQGVKVDYTAYHNDVTVRPNTRSKLATIKEADDSVNESQDAKTTVPKAKHPAGKRKSGNSKTKEKTGRGDNSKDENVQENEKSEKKKKTSEKKTKNHENKNEKPKEVTLTANAGTLKRKLQLKELLEQHNENYEDNLFDSTPFRQRRKRKRAVLDDMDDNAIFEELAKKQGKRFETPVGEDIMTNRRRVKLASARKTPACYYKEDILESRTKNLDGYVHNLKKRQILNAKRRRRVDTPKSIKSIDNSDSSPQKKLFSEFLRAEKDTTENHKDSDCEEDYYWDEEIA